MFECLHELRLVTYAAHALRLLFLAGCGVGAVWGAWPTTHAAAQQLLASDQLSVTISTNGEISSLTLANDAVPTNYVMNGADQPVGRRAQVRQGR